jgi:hypothetical protein
MYNTYHHCQQRSIFSGYAAICALCCDVCRLCSMILLTRGQWPDNWIQSHVKNILLDTYSIESSRCKSTELLTKGHCKYFESLHFSIQRISSHHFFLHWLFYIEFIRKIDGTGFSYRVGPIYQGIAFRIVAFKCSCLRCFMSSK